MSAHPEVRHPHGNLPQPAGRIARWNDHLLTWVAEHILASMATFDAALILPLLALPAPTGVKITIGVISGSWFQWWALPALQRQQIKADAKRDAKADADHAAMTHIAVTVDALQKHLEAQDKVLAGLILQAQPPGK